MSYVKFYGLMYRYPSDCFSASSIIPAGTTLQKENNSSLDILNLLSELLHTAKTTPCSAGSII